MDSERSVVSSALNSGQISTLLARGVEVKHFSNTKSGEEVKNVFSFAAKHARKYGVAPSPQIVKNNFPGWHGEPSSDPLEALIDQFLNDVGERLFAAKVLELAQARDNPSYRGRLDEILLDAARDFAAVFPSGQIHRIYSEMHERIDQYEIEKNEGTSDGIKMMIPVFDDLTGGFQPGDVITVAGYSGRGKSLTSSHFLANAVDQEKTALLMSLEMSAKEIARRFDTLATNCSHKLLRDKKLSDQEVDAWRQAADRYKNVKNDLIVNDKMMGCTVDRVYAEINRYKPDITCVDYVQLMKGSKSSMAKWEGLVEITNELKSIALATDSAIIMVSQDQRNSANEGSTENNMGGSISILQASDLYIGMMQDDEMRAQKKLNIRLIKNRRGAPSEANMMCDPEHMKFEVWGSGANSFDKGEAIYS